MESSSPSAKHNPALESMVEEQLLKRGIHTPSILNAFRNTPRHFFVPEDQQAWAYDDTPLPIGAGQTISQPYVVALIMEYLELEPHHHVLEIGGGSGYATALLARIVKHVDSIEVYGELLERAQSVLESLKLNNIQLRHGSAWEHNSGDQVYDRVVLWASPPKIPDHLIEALSENGRMVGPQGKADQHLWVIEKRAGKIYREKKESVRFVPLVQGRLHEIDRRG